MLKKSHTKPLGESELFGFAMITLPSALETVIHHLWVFNDDLLTLFSDASI